MEDETGRARTTHRGEVKCPQAFGGNVGKKETTRKTLM